MDLLSELIEVALMKFTQLTNEEKMEVATYIIPEVKGVKWCHAYSTCGGVCWAISSVGRASC